jgi:vitamin K-dependent gamma-carboxylase
MTTDRLRDLKALLFEPVDAASLVFFRVSFGLLMAWDQLHYLLGGRLQRFYVDPVFHFKYLGFEWVQVPSEPVLQAVFWGLFVLSLTLAAGLFYRLSAALFCLGQAYVLLLDQATYNNHNYLVCLLAFLLIFVPAHRLGSLDARRNPDLKRSTVPAWAVWLLRFQVGVPYFFGGLAKLNADWLLAGQPMRLWLQTGSVGLRGGFFDTAAAAHLFSWGGLFLDLFMVPALLWRRTRLWAYLIAVAFHLANAFIFNIGFFPWLMIAATTIFFPPSWPRRAGLVGREKPGSRHKKISRDSKAPTVPTDRQKLVLAGLALWVGLQCLLPLRPYLYPGNPAWTDYAGRFSWRMKLREKRGEVRFFLVDRSTRQVQPLQDADALLTARQRSRMAQDPDMIRQFAHFLHDQLADRLGKRDFEIHAQTALSLNGRPRRLLIDPETDLAAEPGRLGPVDWILPLEE